MEKHHHHHHHSENIQGKKLFFTILLNFLITAVQVVGGILSNSLSLLSDALHNLNDGVAILLAYVAMKMGRRPATLQKTFGYKRGEILAAFFNSLVLIGISVFLIFEAVERYMHPTEVKGGIMFWMGLVGLVANTLAVFLLHNEKGENLNIKAAYLHLLGDALTSLAVIIGAGAIHFLGWTWVDPTITILISIYLIVHTWGVFKKTLYILMQFVPEGIEIPEIVEKLSAINGIQGIHHVHLWQLSDKQIHLEAHVEVSYDCRVSETEELKEQIHYILEHKYEINHVTLQFEYQLKPLQCKENCE